MWSRLARSRPISRLQGPGWRSVEQSRLIWPFSGIPVGPVRSACPVTGEDDDLDPIAGGELKDVNARMRYQRLHSFERHQVSG